MVSLKDDHVLFARRKGQRRWISRVPAYQKTSIDFVRQTQAVLTGHVHCSRTAELCCSPKVLNTGDICAAYRILDISLPISIPRRNSNWPIFT